MERTVPLAGMRSTGSRPVQRLSPEKPFSDQNSIHVPLSSPGRNAKSQGAPLGTKTHQYHETTNSLPEQGEQLLDVASHPPEAAPSSTYTLPSDFRPSDNTVVIGKGRVIGRNTGNRRLRLLAAQTLTSYTETSDRRKKTEVLDQLLMTVKSLCPVGAFVRQVGSNSWVGVSDAIAREKIGCILRDLAHDRYRSSAQSKSAIRRQKREKAGGERRLEDRIRAMAASGSSPRFQPDESSRDIQYTNRHAMALIRTEQSTSIPQVNLHAQHRFNYIQIASAQQRQQETNAVSDLVLHQASMITQRPNSARSLTPMIGMTDRSTLPSLPPPTNVATCYSLTSTMPQFSQGQLQSTAPTSWQLHQNYQPEEKARSPSKDNLCWLSVEPVPLGASSFVLPPHLSVAEAVCIYGGNGTIKPNWQDVPMFREQTGKSSAAAKHSDAIPSPCHATPVQKTLTNDTDTWTLDISPQSLSTLGGDEYEHSKPEHMSLSSEVSKTRKN